MRRLSAALAMAVALTILQAGTGRPLAAQQPAGNTQSGTPQDGTQQGAQTPPAGANPAPPPAQATGAQPTFRAGINFVRVDVVVSDNKGQPVSDLKQTDFEVLEDGKPQSIEQFRLIKVDGNVPIGAPPPRELRNKIDEEVEISRDDVRLFVIFFDDYHVRLGNSLAVREPLTRFIQTLGPNDVIGIMYPLTPVDGITLTRNPATALSAIENFQGRKFDYRPRNQFEEQYARAPSEIVEQIRNQVSMTALRGLSIRLGGLREGRKAIIYVSEGFTAMLPPQLRVPDATLGRAGMPPGALPGPLAGENSQTEQTASFFASTDLLTQMREVFAEANRNNAAIYSLDPRGLAPFEYDIDQAVGPQQDARALQMTQDTLRELSEETDGRAIVNRNDLATGLAQIVRDSSYYYLLGYNSSVGPTDGKFHQITVRLKRRGLDVRARKGYWASTPEIIAKANTTTPDRPKPIEQALASIAPSVQSAKFVQTWIGTERGEGGKTRVTLIWEPIAPPPGVRSTQPQPGRVAIIAATQKGDLIFRGRTPDTAIAPAAAPASASGSPAAIVPQRLVFEAPPGDLELRLSVEGTAGGVLDSEVRTLKVPDFTAPDAAISTPKVFRTRNALEFRTIAADAAAVPVTDRSFSRTERLLIRFDVYGNATPTAVLLNVSGKKFADIPIAPTAVGGTHQIDLSLGAIAAGEYLVEITVKGATGDAKELVPLRIGA